mmetsp:Transcript_61014/g.170678  ORF Transcript_61014/g.170678 Transcript_61014/m.170678 type:complete len:399 (-) Transcript_61014:110-1306(-)
MIDYDTGKGIIATALNLKFTIIPLVLGKVEFYMLLGLNVGITYLRRTGYFDPDEYHVDLSMKLTQVTGSLMTFFVVFYNGNVFSRYQKLYELTKGMSENSLYIVSILTKELEEQALVRKLVRLLLASCFMFFFACTHVQGGDSLISDREWQQLSTLGLLDRKEVAYLRKHCDVLKQNAIPAFILMQWSMKLYRTKSARIPDLDKHYYAVRKCQEDVVEMMELPMPFQYFHIMNLMLMLNLCLWAYALALQESYFAPLIFMFVQLMFQGLRELSVALSDPFGDDATDFPLNEWMTGMYLRLYALVEDAYDVNSLVIKQDFPLPRLEDGESIIDVLVDSDAFSEKFSNHTKVKPAEDGGGDYLALPQDRTLKRVEQPKGVKEPTRSSQRVKDDDSAGSGD